MKLKGTSTYVLASAAAGGALYFGISRFIKAKSEGRNGGGSREKLLVRVTENGRKYHRDNCPLLHGETRVINVSDALENYEPCKACHPPGELDTAADEMMDPKRAYSRIVADANGTTARTTASAQMESEKVKSEAVRSESAPSSKSSLSRSSGAATTASSSPSATAARIVDASTDGATSTTNGVQNDPVGEG